MAGRLRISSRRFSIFDLSFLLVPRLAGIATAIHTRLFLAFRILTQPCLKQGLEFLLREQNVNLGIGQ